MVNRVLLTTQFLSGVKALRKAHKNEELEKLNQIIQDLENVNVTTAYCNHPLTNNDAKLNDIHISGDVILLYRYETDIDNNLILTVSLRLDNITDHKKLNQDAKNVHHVRTISEPPVKIKK